MVERNVQVFTWPSLTHRKRKELSIYEVT